MPRIMNDKGTSTNFLTDLCRDWRSIFLFSVDPVKFYGCIELVVCVLYSVYYVNICLKVTCWTLNTYKGMGTRHFILGQNMQQILNIYLNPALGHVSMLDTSSQVLLT